MEHLGLCLVDWLQSQSVCVCVCVCVSVSFLQKVNNKPHQSQISVEVTLSPQSNQHYNKMNTQEGRMETWKKLDPW